MWSDRWALITGQLQTTYALCSVNYSTSQVTGLMLQPNKDLSLWKSHTLSPKSIVTTNSTGISSNFIRSSSIYLGTGWFCKTRGPTWRLKCGRVKSKIDNINKTTFEDRKSAVVGFFSTVNPLHPLAFMLTSTVNA